MLIVAIDTSGKHGSIALYDSEAGESKGSFVEPLAGGTYSADLIPKLADLLERHNFSKGSIDAFVVASGPGSFTGLRVGLSTVKALADALSKPIAAVSVLEAIARCAGKQGRILVALDAGRKQVYVGEFQIDGRTYTSLHERLLDTLQLAEELRNETTPVFTPDAPMAQALLPFGAPVMVVPQPKADLYARIGAERILAGQTISPAELDANYIRRSDAEIFFKGAPNERPSGDSR